VASNISVALAVQENEAVAALTTTGPNGNGLYAAALPVDYGLMRSVALGAAEFNPVDVKTLIARGGAHYAVSGMQFFAGVTGVFSLVYSARVAAFSSDADQSVLLDRYPDVWLYGLLKHAAAVMQDPEVSQAFYEQQFMDAVRTANGLYVDAAFGPGTMARPMGGLV
jgi:hypothetical protein